MDTWIDRNVMGRLLAVAMGASGIDFTAEEVHNVTSNSTSNATSNATDNASSVTRERLIAGDTNGGNIAFYKKYFKLCKSLAFDETLCSLYGKPSVSEEKYQMRWNGHWKKWKTDICDRLTVAKLSRVFTSTRGDQRAVPNVAPTLFWDNFMVPIDNPFAEEHFDSKRLNASIDRNASKVHAPSLIGDSVVPYRGISLDLVRGVPGDNVTGRLEYIVDTMDELGLNLLQLRLMDDLGFVVQLHRRLNLKRADTIDSDYDRIIADIVEYAYHKGIMVMPEISITTRSGGWSESVAHVQCPNVLCEKGQGLAIDLMQSSVWPTLAVTFKILRYIFSSKFIHLGFDERQESMACFNEAKVTPDFDSFEEKLEVESKEFLSNTFFGGKTQSKRHTRDEQVTSHIIDFQMDRQAVRQHGLFRLIYTWTNRKAQSWMLGASTSILALSRRCPRQAFLHQSELLIQSHGRHSTSKVDYLPLQWVCQTKLWISPRLSFFRITTAHAILLLDIIVTSLGTRVLQNLGGHRARK